VLSDSLILSGLNEKMLLMHVQLLILSSYVTCYDKVFTSFVVVVEFFSTSFLLVILDFVHCLFCIGSAFFVFGFC